jgi:hypothetical protein
MHKEHTNTVTNSVIIRGLPGKYPSILNISRFGRVALMQLGSQSEEILRRIREQSLSRGDKYVGIEKQFTELVYCITHAFKTTKPAAQLHQDNAPDHSTALVHHPHQPISSHPQVHQPPYNLDLAPCDSWLFPKLKSPLTMR